MDKVVHFEIPAKDYDRAKKFYMYLFGWQIAEWPGSPKKYGMVTTTPTGDKGPTEPGAINGGLMEPSAPFEQMTIVTIQVASIEDYLKKIETAGGKVLMPKWKVGEMGYMARFADSEGNTVGLWKNIG